MRTNISPQGRWKVWVSEHHLSMKAMIRGPSMSGSPVLIALARLRKLALDR
jgi:hypothetical protein